MKAHEFDRVIKKFQFKTRQADHLLAWFEHNGQKIVRTRRSHGSGDIPKNVEQAIQKQLQLTKTQLREAVSCVLRREGYIEILRERGIL